jgi:predicted metallopeptidase
MDCSECPTINLSKILEALCVDLCGRVPDLSHIDPSTVLFCLSRSRTEGTHGILASIAPLRFPAGKTEHTCRRKGYLETFRMTPLFYEGREILYLIYIRVPRFLRLCFEQKLMTVIHELYHISENCNGDIRRYTGRNFAHGASRKTYNHQIKQLMAHYLASRPDTELLENLLLREEDWLQQKIRLIGLTVPLPKARLIARKRV